MSRMNICMQVIGRSIWNELDQIYVFSGRSLYQYNFCVQNHAILHLKFLFNQSTIPDRCNNVVTT